MKKISQLSLGTSVMIPLLTASVSCGNKIKEKEKNNEELSLEEVQELKEINKNVPISYKVFIDDIKDSAKNDYPTVFLGRNAGQVFNSTFMQLSGILNYKNASKNKFNDAIYIINDNVFQYEKRGTNQRFDFKKLLDKYGDVLSKTASGDFNVEDGKLMIVNNTKHIDPSSDNPYKDYPANVEEIKSYLKLYLDKGVEQFNFYLADATFRELCDNHPDTMQWIFNRANKISIMSDGMYQPYKFIRDWYYKWAVERNKVYTQQELRDFWNKNILEKPKNYMDLRYFINFKEKVKLFNFDGKYDASLNKIMQKTRKDDNFQTEIFDYPVNYNFIKSDIEFNNSYFDDYEIINKLFNKEISDYIVYGKDNYDSLKKNIIFIGSSLFRRYKPDDPTSELRLESASHQYARDEIYKFIKKVRTLYPENKYNYFYKLHPVYKGNEAIHYVNVLTNKMDKKPIILDPSISWENLISSDYKKLQDNQSVFFDKNDFKGDSTKSLIYGLQATTTVIPTTVAFLKGTFDITLDQSKQFVNIKNFPISNSFDILKRDKHFDDPDDAFKHNVGTWRTVFKYFINSGRFFDEEDLVSTNTFIK
ncbi:hypothetical protein [Mycoplasma sp. Mirounga ES2805-ORL]|uniref:hypothetical protein n=1 Tax=Mycoplasma sp. Mirounga ES2805-ORL TaxID=754514 RepID=UPI00197B6612|nr:hypothetical protein [Mycoplasma sp. Mirounga ES2805-ORL]QSF13433.1 hypothetical protein JXZ90_02020 [Mycoplasma sp. Mirounga ES2805-ORL]